jgi:hypothetical protein
MTPAEVAETAGTSPAYVWRVIQGKQNPNQRLIPYLNLLDPKSKDMYFAQRRKGLHEHLKTARELDELVSYHCENPTELFIEIPTDKPIAVCNSADWHIGEPGCDYVQFEKDVDTWTLTDGLYTAFGGDGTENIIQPSKVGSSQNQLPIAVQRAIIALAYKQCAPRNLYVSTGNHNYWSTLAVGEDWDAEIAQRYKLVYTKHAAMIWLKVGKMTYPILRMHKGRFNSSKNLTHTCKTYQRDYFPQARVIVVEHDHVAAMEQYRYNDQECVAIRTGTYATKSDFALRNGFFGAHVSNPTVVYYPDRDKVVPFKMLEDAVIYLKAVR